MLGIILLWLLVLLRKDQVSKFADELKCVYIEGGVICNTDGQDNSLSKFSSLQGGSFQLIFMNPESLLRNLKGSVPI